MKNFRGIIFDLDGTLTKTQQFHFMSFRKVFRKYGVRFTRYEDVYVYAGKGSFLTFQGVFRDRGKKISDEETEQACEEKRRIYSRILKTHKILPVTGIQAFLEQCKKHGMKWIIATGNKPDASKLILKKAGLQKYFPASKILTSKNVEKPKPAPDLFLLAAKKMHLSPKKCIAFGDAINDIKAAKAAGIKIIALSTSIKASDLKKAGANRVIKNYTWIKEL